MFWRFIATGCTALFALSQVHAEEFSLVQSEAFWSSQQRATLWANEFVFLDTGSTLGFGTEVSTSLASKLHLRVGFNNYRNIDSNNKKEINQKFDLKLRSTSLLLDWHPFGGSFRTTIGILLHRHRLRAAALPTQAFHFNDAELSEVTATSRIDLVDDVLTNIELSGIRLSDSILSSVDPNRDIEASDLLTAKGQVRFNSFAPYLGIGWGNTTHRDRRLHYSFDLGIAFHGSPEVDLDVQGIVAELARAQAPQELRAFLAAEEKELEDKLAALDIFPVVSFGLSYRF